ncbi:hypothetical protein LCGC14_2697800 [marine sediment metagenome]|uniref:Uncharacterized protein n=1 Tax=marine sediment metagenome TaxID=412755 RepID=A0A0F9C8I2_9ZZZZ
MLLVQQESLEEVVNLRDLIGTSAKTINFIFLIFFVRFHKAYIDKSLTLTMAKNDGGMPDGMRSVMGWTLGVGIIAFVLLILAIIFNVIPSDAIYPSTISSTSQTILVESTSTLSPIAWGITSSEVKANNDTWINCTLDDFVESERYDTISFWYKNSTVDWTFVVNSSGTLYVDGVLGTPGTYPVYDSGTKMFICKTGASTFFNGSMDDFRGYASAIDAELVNLTYLGGRL